MAEDKAMACPFCGWTNPDGEYEMLLHLETYHAEGEDASFRQEQGSVSENPESGENISYVECPIDGCEEILPLQELDYHLELHSEESGGCTTKELDPVTPAEPDPHPGPSRAHRAAQRHRQSDPRSEANERHGKQAKEAGLEKATAIWKRLLKIPVFTSESVHMRTPLQNEQLPNKHSPHGKRLGKAHLGKYAHESRMPEWLVSLLKREGQVTSQGVISVLAVLLEQSPSTEHAYLCHPRLQHVSKLKREGGFCGYRNIQMLASYIIEVKSKGHEHFCGTIPSIFQIQEWIETAWDLGINSQARLETGGIRGTRKYIGTPEAVAVFRLLNIPCEPHGIKFSEPGKSEAHLMEYVENYFQLGVQDPTQRVHITNLPPIYFQHLVGHSLTIIGFEKLKNGTKQLLVFDPSFHDSSYIIRLIGQTSFKHPAPDLALRAYRRGNDYLKRHRSFELVKLVPP
ncbi:peptidase family C78-domain-containing protein [Thermothelomyces heterothallicus CBS 202.75]|uniref:peptidase family C78-domain-containing protein n=1 Tax=Thermothelomyces heterothallicus CBS 202.75 TaxID=1149848 RepID=UPI003744AFE6